MGEALLLDLCAQALFGFAIASEPQIEGDDLGGTFAHAMPDTQIQTTARYAHLKIDAIKVAADKIANAIADALEQPDRQETESAA